MSLRTPWSPICPNSANLIDAVSLPLSVSHRSTETLGRCVASKLSRVAELVFAVLFTWQRSAIRWNAVISEHYKSLVERGRPKKVALVACMRRLLGILNAIIQTKTQWQCA
jgi:hypothetical protein